MAKLMFNKSHEWILIEGETAKIGLSEFAVSQLGDIVFVELPNIGDKIQCGASFMNVESVKAVSQLYAPACGEIIAINDELDTNPELINTDAKNTWIVQIKLEKASEGLLTEEEYNGLIG